MADDNLELDIDSVIGRLLEGMYLCALASPLQSSIGHVCDSLVVIIWGFM